VGQAGDPYVTWQLTLATDKRHPQAAASILVVRTGWLPSAERAHGVEYEVDLFHGGLGISSAAPAM